MCHPCISYTLDLVNVTPEDVLTVQEHDAINFAQTETSWVIDSGASVHVTARRDLFSSYTPGDFGDVRTANEGVTRCAGIGDICLKTGNGSRLILRRVKHVPDIRLNLLSVSKLCDDGYDNNFSGDNWKLTKGVMVIASGKKYSNLYLTRVEIIEDVVHAAESGDETELWHKRLCHMSEKGLTELAKKSVLPGVKKVHLKKCTHCLAGKQNRVSFKSHTPTRRPEVLDLIHSDVCGPMSTMSLGGAYYFVTFIDDHSRKIWVYTLRSKDQVLSVFKQFQASVERETGKKLKCIRTDNGGEYIGPFDAYCREQGIRHQKTPPKTPQLNGLAERMNRTLVERVRCLISQAGLSKSFWGEALSTAAHVINLSPSIPLQLEVPERIWSGKEVCYDYLRVFGCRAFVHIPKDERSKLDVKTKQCIFLGYGQDEFGYRLYDPVNKKIIRSRDVVFMEDQTKADFQIEKVTEPLSSSVSVDLDIVPPALREDPHVDDIQDDQPDAVDIDNPIQEEGTEDADMEQPADETPTISLRRSTRVRQPSSRYPVHEYILLTDTGEPECYDEAIEDDHRNEWIEAMQDEMRSLHENHTFELVKLPKGKKALKNKWVFRIKHEEHSSRPRYKARLVVKGFGQRKGIDFGDIFSPVVKMTSIRAVFGLAASFNLEIEQMDVKTAFLHGDLEEEIYMEQPEGFKMKDREDYVCKLKKSLYGLKQAPRQWFKKFESVMREQGYQKTTSDNCVFVQKFSGDDFIILLLYVDDILIVGKNVCRINALKKQLSKSFAMKDLGAAKQMLGITIERDRSARKLYLSQEKYIQKVLQRFCMDKAKAVSSPLAPHFKLSTKQCPTTCVEKEEMKKIPYASAVGSLMYAMVCTRPDIAYAVGMVSRFLSNPGKEHWDGVKWIMRYLCGTSDLKLSFGENEPVLVGFTDADLAGDIDSRKSTSGYLINFAGGAVSWQSRLQKCVALSTTEAEFIATTESCKELLWMKKFLRELNFEQKRYVLLCDNQSAIHLGKNSSFHSRSKHIDIRYHWIRDVLNAKLLDLEKIHTDDNGADMLTKSLTRDKLETCRLIAGMVESS
ncbi:Retrovirus-related Pol polyprotein from transposon TNT 1-94 [Melia azedarach]|uniref:Retrovirus-related Pol polyprotein from transposon TNT 1-94 n=1 Tax=Melia azedarach TaxID=155640 RepID=A0ACC1YET4_MELAZ|nr:Retrovirus-related Pol polyprotein from transposon TNT 1-94 [Melia azedarach]